MYRDKLTKKTINDSLISSNTDAGITYYDNGVWRFVAAGQLEETSDNDSSLPLDNAMISSDANTVEVDKIITASDVTTETEKYFTYYFGIAALNAANKTFYNKCAHISPVISVGTGSTLRIKVDYYEGKYSSIEFSLIDGINEYPILPQEKAIIENEQLFYQLPLRFASEECSLYENFELVGNTIKNLTFKPGSIYTANYIPKNNDFHIAIHSSVRIKAILRLYKQDAVPPQINSITLIETKEG